METEVTKELVFSYFARKTSPLQSQLIAQWLREGTNEELYYQWLEEWENKNPQYLTQTQPALERYQAFITGNPNTEAEQEPEEERPLPVPTRWRYTKLLVAASLLLCLSLAAYILRQDILYQTHKTSFGETRRIQLPDGSTVLMNANSCLRVPRWGFGNSTREVWLNGEAQFSVTHTPNHLKFIVKTEKNFEVEVLGTEFTVFARKRGARVTLNKGHVQVHYKQGEVARKLSMKPGDLVEMDNQNHLDLKRLKTPQPSWNEKRFVFDEMSLREVAYLLEENYGLQVEIKNPALAERELMGSFRAENVDQLLQSISELLDIDVVRQGDQVLLKDH